MAAIERHRTAIGRSDLSRPIPGALTEQLIRNGCCVLDYGCGLGSDVAYL